MLFDPRTVARADVERMMVEVVSWDLCDHLCKNLIVKMKGYEAFIFTWITSGRVYERRAAFTLMAASAIHDKKLPDETLDIYLKLLYEHADYAHEHVKKAASWALREIGKRDFAHLEKAVLTAHDLRESGNPTKNWIAKDALKELESAVKVEGRTRLISTGTKMGGAQ